MKIVTLCGSTKFKKQFEQVAYDETLKGNLVFTVHAFRHDTNSENFTSKQLWELDQLHFAKIKLSDEIFVINVNGYAGLGLCDEVAYADSLNLPIRLYTEEYL